VQEQLAAISNRAQENLSGIQQVKIYAQEEREAAGFHALCEEFRVRNLALARQRALLVSLIGVLAGCGTVLVIGLGERA
jgi:ABC-type multidrug transport system fused ATPase/permease subunit